MSVSQTLKKGARVMWQVLAIIIGLAGVPGVYYQFFSGPSITSQMTSEVNVLDVHRPVASLQVLFQGSDIQQTGMNLRIYRVTYTNNGTTDINQGEFDQNTDWGIRVENGSIVEARLVNTDSNYLKSELNPQVSTTTTNLVRFNKVVFDKGASFTVELVILHDKNVSPELYGVGKIAGIKETRVEISPYQQQESFWAALISGSFHGSLYVNIVRFAVYALISIILFIVFILFYAKLNERKTRATQAPQPPQQPKT